MWRWTGVRVSRRDLAALAALGVVAIPVNQGLFLYGMTLTTPGHAALLYALAWLLAHRWRLLSDTELEAGDPAPQPA